VRLKACSDGQKELRLMEKGIFKGDKEGRVRTFVVVA
jgi:hypothetical protein